MITENKVIYLSEMLSFWQQLSHGEKEEIITKSQLMHYEKGEIVHTKQAECTGVLVVVEGAFRSYIAAPNGREITLFELYERDVCMLSAACAFRNITYDINLMATEKSIAILVDSATFKALAQQNHYAMAFLLELTQDKLSEILYTLEQAVFFPLDQRIANYLYEQYKTVNSKELYLTHEMIANHLGSSREVISRILKKFEEENIVTLSRGRMTLMDIAKLLEKRSS